MRQSACHGSHNIKRQISGTSTMTARTATNPKAEHDDVEGRHSSFRSAGGVS